VHVILLLESVVFQKLCWLSVRLLAASKIMSVDVNLLKSRNSVTSTQNYRYVTPCGDFQHSWSQPSRGCACHDVSSATIIFHYNLIWERLVNAYLYMVQPNTGNHYRSSTSRVEWLWYKVQKSIYSNCLANPFFEYTQLHIIASLRGKICQMLKNVNTCS